MWNLIGLFGGGCLMMLYVCSMCCSVEIVWLFGFWLIVRFIVLVLMKV